MQFSQPVFGADGSRQRSKRSQGGRLRISAKGGVSTGGALGGVEFFVDPHMT